MSDGTPKPATWPMCRGPLAYGHATATRMRLFGPSMGPDDTAHPLRRPPSQERDEGEDTAQERGDERDVRQAVPPRRLYGGHRAGDPRAGDRRDEGDRCRGALD